MYLYGIINLLCMSNHIINYLNTEVVNVSNEAIYMHVIYAQLAIVILGK